MKKTTVFIPNRSQDLDNFSQRHTIQTNKKLLSQALVYLKLREVDCDKKRALAFAKKKQKQIDATVQKDGPPGYRNLIPLKDPSRQIYKGWSKQKLKYQGTQGYAQQIEKAVSQQKKSITQFNAMDRKAELDRRKYQKGYGLRRWINNQEINRFNDGLKNVMKDIRSKSQHSFKDLRSSIGSIQNKNQQIKAAATPTYLQQINLLRDDIMKERQLKPMYVTFHGEKMHQITKNYVRDIQQSDPNGFIARLGVFQDQVLKNAELIQGQGKQGQFQQKREKIYQFRQSLKDWKPKHNLQNNRQIGLQKQDYRNLENISNLTINSPRKNSQEDIEINKSKILMSMSKNRSSVNFSQSNKNWMKNYSLIPSNKHKQIENLMNKNQSFKNKNSPSNQDKFTKTTSSLKNLSVFKKTKSLSKQIPRTTLYGASIKNWKKKDRQFEQDFQKIVALIQLSKLPKKKEKEDQNKNKQPQSPYSPRSPLSPSSPLLRNNSNVSDYQLNKGQQQQQQFVDHTQFMKTKIWNL